jgi:hypothetical protein
MSVFNAENVFEKTCSESFDISTYTQDVQETKMKDNEPDHQEETSTQN